MPTVGTDAHAPYRSPLRRALAEAEQATLGELEALRQPLRLAVKAAMTQDSQLAEEVSAQAETFDRRYADVHDKLVYLMARQGPVAGDLRLAIALLHVNDRAARIGAQCLNIATLACAAPSDARLSEDQMRCLSEMARLADEQLQEAAAVLAHHEGDGVDRIKARDASINQHNRDCFSLAVDTDDHARRQAAFFVALMARAIERIGDNAVDIAQQAAFAATGRLRPASGH